MSIKTADRMEGINPSAVREIFKWLSDPEMISFAGGNPSEETFPIDELAAISAELYQTSPVKILQYGISEGYWPLRELTKNRLREKYGIGSDDDELMIVTGGQQGIDLALKCFTNEGDAVVVENPSFIGGLNDIRSYATRLIGVPMDDDGMDMDALENVLKTEKNVKLIYTIPTFQNPMGVTMSLERRRRLLELSVQYDVMVLEDSPYFELRYSGEYVPSIKSLDTTGNVIFCGSYSKIFGPGLRLGFISVPKKYFQTFAVAKQCSDVHTTSYAQLLVTQYLKEHDVNAHIENCCRIYRQKRDRMLRGLEEHLPAGVKFTRPQGGIFVWCSLPEGYSGHDFFTLAAEHKVAVVPGGTFDADSRDMAGVRLNFSMPSDEQIDRGTKILGECFRKFLK